jgi:dephospho-CoA kinase
VLLVTGLPGCGKSTFVRYASERRKGRAVILEELAPDDELRRLWLSGLLKGDAKAFVRALRNHPREAVVEWGFPVNAPCIAFIKSMKDNGVRVVWFECPDDVALARYRERDDRPVEPFDAQVSSIRENYESIMGEVEPEIIDVLDLDGSARSTEELYDLVWPK